MNNIPIKIQRNLYYDKRGAFSELYRASESEHNFVQDNLSISRKNVLRGMYHQKTSTQGKLVTVISGSIQDIVVDVDPNSEHYGKHYEYNVKAGEAIWCPPNYLHGFLSLEDTILLYKCTDYYDPTGEVTVNAFDEKLNLPWRLTREEVIMSDKDSDGISFDEVLK